jgi:PPIC-type PPIASE domain
VNRVRFRWTPVVVVLALSSCQDTGGAGVVAQSGDHVFSVDDVVALFAAEPRLPNDAEVIEQLAELWVDYTLVALAAREDTLLENIDLSALVEPQVDQLLVDRYLEREAPVDTVLTDAELRQLWDENPPRGPIQARHILFTYPFNATPDQRDSVRSSLTDIRSRIIEGASFDRLARQYSQDPGSAEFGGDLGVFGPGDMVGAFEDAAYALDVGQVSDLVDTPFGVHVIRLDSREDPDFEAGKEGYRQRIVMDRLRTSDSLFLSGIEEQVPVSVAEDAPEINREIAKRYRVRLYRRARARTVASFDGGELTAGEVWNFLQTRTSQFVQQVAAASDYDLEGFLRNLSQAEVLRGRAAAAGIEVSEVQRDSLEALWRDQVVQAADAMGLRLITPEAGETSDQTVDRVVRQVIAEVASGARSAIPLNAATVALREELDGEVMARGVSAVVTRLSNLRGPFPRPGATPPPVADSSATLPDTVAGG